MDNIGVFRERIGILRVVETADAVSWEPLRRVSALAKIGKNTIFAKNGLTAQGWDFTIRKQDVTLFDVVSFDGHLHMITAIDTTSDQFWVVTAARIVDVVCQSVGSGRTFPGALVEKYLKFDQLEPMTTTAYTFVLVTPKCVDLAEGSIVTIDGVEHCVRIGHRLDVYKNEFEVERFSDN